MEPLVIIIKLIVLAIILTVIVKVIVPKPLFVIVIKSGRAIAKHGTVTKSFLTECERICSESNISKGKIKAVRNSGRVSLRFSYHIPKHEYQKFRNSYSSYS